MAITAEAQRGGIVETLGDATYSFNLRNREIERFEDKYRGIFDLWEGFFSRGTKLTSKEVRDLVALGLVGGGMKDAQADAVINDCTPEDLLRLYQIAQALLGVAFMPDVGEEKELKKKTEVGDIAD